MDSSAWSLTAAVCLLASFFLIGPEVIRQPMLGSMMRRVAYSVAHQITWLSAGVLVYKVTKGFGGYFVEIERVDIKKTLPMLRRWAALYFVPWALIRVVVLIPLTFLGYGALTLLLVFNAWARWESDVRGWAIVAGVILFVSGAAAQVALAVGRL